MEAKGEQTRSEWIIGLVKAQEADIRRLQKLNTLNEGDAKNFKACWDAACHDVEKLKQRIEELKQENRNVKVAVVLAQELLEKENGEWVLTSHEHIALAIEWIDSHYEAGSLAWYGAWRAFNLLNIYLCKWCKGTGKLYEWGKGDDKQPCNACEGKRYTIGEGDE